jgi:hypothetical protein
MEAIRWMPRIGAACAAVMLLVLAVPAAQASDVRRSGSSQLRIHYSDSAAATDRVVVTPAATQDDQLVVFTVQSGGAPIDTGGNPCDGTPTVRTCVADSAVVDLLIDAGGGNDFFDLRALPGPTGGSEFRDLPAIMNGGAGNDELMGSANADSFDGGLGNDMLTGLSGPDHFVGGPGSDTLTLALGGPWTVSLDGIANDGPRSSPTANVDADVEVIIGGAMSDTLTGASGRQTINGGGGADTLDGGADGDGVNGAAGDDTISARDGAVDNIACGDGADTVTADWNDAVGADCETVRRSVRDDDGDGAGHGVDCNDADPAIKPGAGDIPGNGVDEDCDGTDAVLDRDGDGAAAGVDCDDADAARRPGAVDIPANGVDEDCSGADAARPALDATFASGWSVFARWTLITRLRVKDAPAGAKLQVRCRGKGCPFKRKSVKLKKGAANLTRLFKGRKLRPGAVIQVRVTAPGTIGKIQRITVRRRKDPKRITLCLEPGSPKPSKCA